MIKYRYFGIMLLVIDMRSIENTILSEYEIQKSKFITYLFPIHSLEEVEQNLKEVKQKSPDATHYCYAYLFHNEKRCSDDKEPSGTAGMPILNVLEKQNLNCVMAIVVRYFGGTLLGAGGLVRAYTTAVVEALKKANYVSVFPGKEIELVFSYEKKQIIDSLLKNVIILKQQFLDSISYQILIPDAIFNTLQTQLKPHIFQLSIIKDTDYIQKETT